VYLVSVFCNCVCVKSLLEKKKKLQEEVARQEAEIEELRASHEVSCLEIKLITVFFVYFAAAAVSTTVFAWFQSAIAKVLILFLTLSLTIILTLGPLRWRAAPVCKC